MWRLMVLLVCTVFLANAAPQGPADESGPPQPYEYTYEVKEQEKELFFDKNEVGDASGKVTGKYSVWLPDNRLMTVDYTVDKESGFVPKISFTDANPFNG